MGFGLVLLFQLVFVFVLSLALAIIGSLIVLFIKSKRKGRLYLFAFHAPFFACFTFYFFSLVAALYIGEQYDVDSGIGDTWYVPLAKDSRLLSIDLPGIASIERGGNVIVDDVVLLYQKDSLVFGKTDGNAYFVFKGDSLVYPQGEAALLAYNEGKPINWSPIEPFYQERRSAIAGRAETVALMLCVLISVGIVWVLKLIILRKGRAATA